MKLVLAQMKHETNTFSPVPTQLARFGHGRERPWEGREAYEEFKGTGTAVGNCRDIATNRTCDIAAFRAVGIDPAAKRYLMLARSCARSSTVVRSSSSAICAARFIRST